MCHGHSGLFKYSQSQMKQFCKSSTIPPLASTKQLGHQNQSLKHDFPEKPLQKWTSRDTFGIFLNLSVTQDGLFSSMLHCRKFPLLPRKSFRTHLPLVSSLRKPLQRKASQGNIKLVYLATFLYCNFSSSFLLQCKLTASLRALITCTVKEFLLSFI